MSGFVAIVGPRSPHRSAEIEAFVEAYVAVRGSGPTSPNSAPQVEAVHFDAPSRPTPHEEQADGSWAFIVGDVHVERSLLAADLVELDGQFALVRYSADQEELVVATDPFGMQPLYHAARNGTSYLSTSALSIARHLSLPLDDLGVHTYLRCGHQFGALTNWQGLSRLEPGTAMVFRNDSTRRFRYWKPEVDDGVARLDFEAAVDHCIRVAQDVFQRMYSAASTWSDLTAGYDTRMMNLLMSSAGVDIHPETRQTARRLDPIIAEKVSRAAGWDWTCLELPRTWAEDIQGLVPIAVGWGDAHLDALNLARDLWAHRELSLQRPLLLNGLGADHFRGHAWRQEFLREGRSNRVNLDNLVDMRLMHPMDTALFADDPTRGVRDDVRRRVDEWREPHRSELNTVQLDLLLAYKNTGHAGAYSSADGHYLTARLPCYLKPIFTTAFSTSHRFRNHHRLMRAIIGRLNPAVARIATDSGGPAEPWRWTNLHRFLPYYAQLARRAANKASEGLIGRALWPIAGSRPQWVEEGTRRYVASLELTPSSMLSGSLYDRRSLESLLESVHRGGSITDELGRILTVELALRLTTAKDSSHTGGRANQGPDEDPVGS